MNRQDLINMNYGELCALAGIRHEIAMRNGLRVKDLIDYIIFDEELLMPVGEEY